jgi:asparagine synthase (glutamine-hydrolysing)
VEILLSGFSPKNIFMCGIAGILRFNGEKAGLDAIRTITNCMQHRGPDADGFFTEGPIALGHRRLSIIDLSEVANQPMADGNDRYIIVFNGEIYNFREVKQELKGYRFQTNGDTEVVLAAYEKWGDACFDKLKGMFAFALWDKRKEELVIARDRMGVKPLYYYHDDRVLVFASEIRAILKSGFVKPEILPEAVKEYFSYQSIGFPHSIIKDIRQLEAGSFMRISRNGQAQHKKYWNILTKNNADYSDKKQVQQNIRQLLMQSVAQRLISDVPLGAFLSGGIDSSAVVALMAQVSNERPNTFTVAFDEPEFDESEYAAIIAKKYNTRHHTVLLQPASFLNEVHNALEAMDSPSGDGINTYVVSKAIRQSGLTVALSGIGGDELFAGYPIFRQFLQLKKNQSVWALSYPLRKLAAAGLSFQTTNKSKRLQQLIEAPQCTIDNFYPVFRQILAPATLKKYTSYYNHGATALEQQLKEHKKGLYDFPLLSQVSVAEYMGYTQHTLLKDTDQMSMAVSLEVREPFFDHDLVTYVLGIPDAIKYPVYPKSLLVSSLNGLLPDEIVHRQKKGFVLPWSIWMRNELRSFCDDRIKNISQRPFINEKALLTLWKDFVKGDPAVRWLDIWLFVVLEHWLEKNMAA